MVGELLLTEAWTDRVRRRGAQCQEIWNPGIVPNWYLCILFPFVSRGSSYIHSRLFPWTWEKCADVLLRSCPRCSLVACAVVYAFLITFVWPYLAVCTWEVQRDRVTAAVLFSGDRYGSLVPKWCSENRAYSCIDIYCLRTTAVDSECADDDDCYWQLFSFERSRRSGVR